MTCANCGAELVPGDGFCSDCGAAVESGPPPSRRTPRPAAFAPPATEATRGTYSRLPTLTRRAPAPAAPKRSRNIYLLLPVLLAAAAAAGFFAVWVAQGGGAASGSPSAKTQTPARTTPPPDKPTPVVEPAPASSSVADEPPAEGPPSTTTPTAQPSPPQPSPARTSRSRPAPRPSVRTNPGPVPPDPADGALEIPELGPGQGALVWTGVLSDNARIVIENGRANIGEVSGDPLPGSPIELALLSPDVRLVERPSPRNGWKRVAFRCLRSSRERVRILMRWTK